MWFYMVYPKCLGNVLFQESNVTNSRSAWRTPTPQKRREGTYVTNSINPERTYIANSANPERTYVTSASSEKDPSRQQPSSGRRQKVANSINSSFNNLRPLPPTHNGHSGGGEDDAAVNGYRTKQVTYMYIFLYLKLHSNQI